MYNNVLVDSAMMHIVYCLAYSFLSLLCENVCDNRFKIWRLLFFFVSPKKTRRAPIKKNPLKNSQVMIRLNPYWQTFKRQQYLIQQRRLKAKEAAAAAKK